MKKTITLLALAFCLNINAQYTKLLDFNSTANGATPYGNLISDGTFLYGMTSAGGTSTNCAGGCGNIFKIKTNGTSYSTILNFSGTNNGANPWGSLYSDGTYLYGMTQTGGVSSDGNIFKITLNGATFAVLHDFAGSTTDGSTPLLGSLISDGTFLYGMTQYGGTNDSGTVFRIMPNGTRDSVLYNFSGTDGSHPLGSLVSVGGILYGMTYYGGTHSMGTIFKIMPNGTGYDTLLTFNGTNGQNPAGSLVSDGTYLYGMTQNGGGTGAGLLFKIKPDGTGYAKLTDFFGQNGQFPAGSLIYDGSTFLYGMTTYGGATGAGTIFKIKPDGTGYADLFDFNGTTTGGAPTGDLFSDGTFLYGMTSVGGTSTNCGTNGCGTLFKFYPISVSATMLGAPICSNQCNSSASASVFHCTPPITYSWSTSPVQTTTVATNLCAGHTYTVTVSDVNGSASDTVTIASVPKPVAPAICEVSTDSVTNYKYNIIYWNKTLYNNVDSFLVYRYDAVSTNYLHIGSVSKTSLSEWADTAFNIGGPNGGNPAVGSWQYKLAILDTCGNTSPLSPYHASIFVQESGSNFSWTQYIDSGYASMPTGYSFLRDDYNTGSFHVLANLGHTATSCTDPNYSSYPNANWRVDALGFNCTPTLRLAGNNSTDAAKIKSHSNINNNRVQDIKQFAAKNEVSIYPNPASQLVNLKISEFDNLKMNSIVITDMLGNVTHHQIITSSNSQIDISDLAEGVYNFQISTSSNYQINKKVVIVR
ncbi:MAG: choice-of-anchor tandem repeat GloVer-containing protein [Bacteroidia bacterium]